MANTTATQSQAAEHIPEGLQNSRKIFQDVSETFRNSLPPMEKALFREFDDPRFMIKQLQEEVKAYPNGRKLAKLCSKVEGFASAMAPFFDIIAILVSSHPEFAALAWGAVRLVFLLGSSHTIFFEKLAYMFERIGDRLPGYGEYCDRVLKRWSKIPTTEEQKTALDNRCQRLVKALTYVYADIIQFCQEACRIFSTSKKGLRCQGQLMLDLFRKPFDARFAALMDRLCSHEALFNSEMQLEESRFLEMQFVKHDSDLGAATDFMENIQIQMDELRESNRAREAAQADAYVKLDSRLREISEKLGREGTDSVLESKLLKSKATDLTAWINAPDHEQEYNKARSKRARSTCEWVIWSTDYAAWKSYVFEAHVPLGPPSRQSAAPILFITAKPGFGKTILSSFIIDDLENPPISSDSSNEIQLVLYFYFLSERPDFSTPSHAWRAILAQFLQKYKDHADTVDALSILHDNNTSGQLHATDDEVYQSLLLLLAQANRVTLLIDGIDECIDSDDFLSGLHDVCRKTSTKAVLLGRAGIRIPQSFIDFTLFNLNQTHNRDDITRYLRPEIESLQTDTLISPELPPEKIISTLVDRSQGMFLWASLMVRYLNCEALSPNERREAIFHLHVVQGIEGLYHRILMTLQNTYTKQLERVIKIFSLITVARWPLKVSELQFALAVRPGIPTDEGDLIRRFRASLPIMCRSLVEISDQDSVTFVHSSFRDFLTNVDGPLSGTPFLVNSAVAHINVSATCLSCLLYDIPCGPLSQSGKRADALFVAEVLCPWLEYSLNWTYHATTGLQLLALINGEQDGEATSELIRLLSTFLEQRLRITTWFEAAWTFTSNPSLTPLVELFSCSENSCIQGEMGKHPRMVANLKACAADLCRLHREWGHLLSLKPNAIWRSSITAFTKSEYLYETSNTIVSSLAPPEVLGHSLSSENQVAQSAILIQSQVSDSGLTLGIIFVLPSQAYITGCSRAFDTRQPAQALPPLTSAQRQRFIEIASRGWKVKYQQRSTLTEGVLVEIEYELPQEDVCQLLCQSLHSNEPDRFPFPIAFSNDLRRVVILRTLITLVTNDDAQSTSIDQAFKVQKLGRPHGITKSREDKTVTYSPTFSPVGNALAFVIGTSKATQLEQRLLEIWSQKEPDSHDSDYLFRGSVIASWLSAVNFGNNASFGFVFHPRFPIIAVSEWMRISAWWFNDQPSQQRVCLTSKSGVPKSFPHTNILLISSLQPSSLASKGFSVSKASKMIDKSNLSDPPGPSCEENITFESTDIYINIQRFINLFECQYYLPNLEDQSLSLISEKSFTNDSDWIVRRMPLTNAVVLEHRGLSADARVLLTHLPRTLAHEQTYISMLRFSENDQWMRLVYNKDAQKSYSCQDPANPYLPAIISRKLDTIEPYPDEHKSLKRKAVENDDNSKALLKKRLSRVWRKR